MRLTPLFSWLSHCEVVLLVLPKWGGLGTLRQLWWCLFRSSWEQHNQEMLLLVPLNLCYELEGFNILENQSINSAFSSSPEQ